MAEFLRPGADVSIGNWKTKAGGTSNLYSELDESSADSADYIISGVDPNEDAAKFELTDPSGDITDGIVRIRFRKDGPEALNVTARLLQDHYPTTWNPSDKGADITLSGGDLVATTGAGTADWVRSVSSKLSGKVYFEYTLAAGSVNGEDVYGFANAAWDGTTYLGETNDGLGWYSDGTIYRNGGGVATVGSFTGSSVLGFAIDFDNEKIWFRPNGGNWNNAAIGSQNPATNTGGYDFSAMAAGPYFAAFSMDGSGDSVTANFGASDFAYSAPSGFSNLGDEAVIAEWQYVNVADTDVDEEETLTAPQIALITDPNDLRIEIKASVAPLYTGPGDLVPGAIAWWGLRAYSAATAAASANCVDLRRDGASPALATFTVLPDGSLDVASIAAFLAGSAGATNLFCEKLYDQSGNGRDVIQTNTGAGYRPLLQLATLNGLPTLFQGAMLTAGTVTQAQPLTVSFVGLFDGALGRWTSFAATDDIVYTGHRGTDAIMSAGGENTFAISSAWHRVQSIILNDTGGVVIDGSFTGSDPHTFGFNAEQLGYHGLIVSAQWGSNSTELGVWPIAFDAGQYADMDANQNSYYGFNTFNSSDKHADVTLSNGNLTAYVSALGVGIRVVRSVASVSASDKVYVEYVFDTIDVAVGDTIGAGFILSSTALNGFAEPAAYSHSSYWFYQNVASGDHGAGFSGTTPVSGAVICLALDRATNKIWGRLGNGNWNNDVIGNQNPATGTGGFAVVASGVLHAAVSLNATVAPVQITARFSSDDWQYAAPSGFGQLGT